MPREQAIFAGNMNEYVRKTYKKPTKKVVKKKEKREKREKRKRVNLLAKLSSRVPKKNPLGGGWLKKIFIVLGCLLLLIFLAAYIWFYFTITKNLPDVKNLENIVFSEATILTDRNGEELYKMYQENRDYVPLDAVSEHMVNAIIAVEDQTFWKNPGISFQGITRTVLGQIGVIDYDGGGSTITQQLLKNILLDTTESRYIRKLKERSLAGRLNDIIKDDIKKEYTGLSKDELQQRSKEKILEMYLNYIFLGQNAYGVEAAARTYFNTTADQLDVLESSIIASLPKSPSTLNPYKNRELLMGRLVIQKGDDIEPLPENIKDQVIKRIQNNLKTVDFDKANSNSFVKTVRGLSDFTITVGDKKYQVAYEPGRKDFSLMNIFDEEYIDQVQLKKAFVSGLDLEFEQGSTKIDSPHFVHWVQELLLQDYDEETLLKGGLIVKTSLDNKAQKAAEQAVEQNRKNIASYGGNNASLVYLDSKNGDVLAYVGSADYFDEDIDGKVDMVRASRQPGSSVKPFIYALGIEKLGLTLDTPIFDLPITLGENKPNNADGEFLGLQPLKEALGYSRNIGPIKTYIAAGGESAVKPYLKNLGLRSLQDGVSYGYPLSIGAGEIQMLELANAYMHLSAAGQPAQINPILEIRTTNGSIVYQKEVKKQRQIIPSGVATMIRKVLSDRGNVPSSWVKNFTMNGIENYALKTGTTDKKEEDENGEELVLPRDGWIATYTPSKVAVFWGGNTDGAPMKQDAYGGWINSPAMKTFYGELLTNDLIQDETYPESETKSITIDKLSGRAIASNTPSKFQVSTIGYVHNMPVSESRGGYTAKVDTLCNGKWTELTPPEDTGSVYIVKAQSFMPNNDDISQIKGWLQSESGYRTSAPTQVCEKRSEAKDDTITVQILKPLNNSTITKNFEVRYTISGERPLKYVRVYLDGIVVAEESTAKKNVTQIEKIAGYAGLEPGAHQITVEVVDEDGFVNRSTHGVNIGGGDTDGPILLQDRIQATSNEDGTYTIYLLFSDLGSVVKGGSLSAGSTSKRFDGNLTSIVVGSGASTISYSVTDIHGNTNQGSVGVGHLLR